MSSPSVATETASQQTADGGGGDASLDAIDAVVDTSSGEREVPLPVLSLLAFVVGIVAALGAIVFKLLIGFIYNVAFYGEFSFHYDPNAFGPPSPLGPLIIAVPVIGGLVVVYLVKKFAPEAKGHGVPEVMYAIYHQGGNVRGIVAVVKSLASALSIGTGASVGREGPIIQIGSSFGSTLGRRLEPDPAAEDHAACRPAPAPASRRPSTRRSAACCSPREILLPEISARSFLPVVIATATSTYVSPDGDRRRIGLRGACAWPFRPSRRSMSSRCFWRP